MALNKNQRVFRTQRAQDLITLADLIEKVNIPSHQLRNAAKELKDFERTKKIQQTDNIDYSFWGYNINSIEIPFDECPRHIKPEKLSPLSAVISIDMIASCDSWGHVIDPLKKLEFDIEIQGNSDKGKHAICYHIDRHIDSDSDEAHPQYHFHYGGRKMNYNEINIGNVIFLDTPRIMFYPIDVILGFDFVLSNFFPILWHKLRKESAYNSLVKEYYNSLVKPFAHSLASNWNPYNPQSIKWEPHIIFPQL